MSKYDFEKIISQVQDSPTARMIRKIQNDPTAKVMREIQNSPAAKVMREMQDSPAMKMMREIQNSPAAKVMREMQDSPAMKMMREIQNSPATKVMREMQDSPAMKMMREIQNSPAFNEIHITLKSIQSSNTYFEIIEDSIGISDEAIDTNNSKNINQLNSESLFINTILLSICILSINTQVSLDQILVNLAQNLLNSTLFFYLQSKYEIAKISSNGIDKNDFKNSRITTKSVSFHFNPQINSELIETLEPYKFLEIIYEPDLHKSWLKVRVAINGEILEGYVLRRYTSPIK